MPQIANSFPFRFYGTTIEVHMADDGHWYIRLDHMCEYLGLNLPSQRRKLQQHPAIGNRCVLIVLAILMASSLLTNLIKPAEPHNKLRSKKRKAAPMSSVSFAV